MGTLILVVITSFFFTAAATAQTSTFDGVWVYAGGSAEKKKRVAQIESATKDMSAFTRGTAQKKLTEQTKPAPKLELAVSKERLELKGTNGKAISLQLGGQPIEVGSDEKSTLSARKKKDHIVVLAKAENGSRTTTYSLSPDGKTLTLSVRMEGERLSGPLNYKLTYSREAE